MYQAPDGVPETEYTMLNKVNKLPALKNWWSRVMLGKQEPTGQIQPVACLFFYNPWPKKNFTFLNGW